jgi:hypothetical protein
MGTRASPAANRQVDGAGRRGVKIVAAARMISIDYRSIVDNAIAGLPRNTPDARREVYDRARGIVKRRLGLMRLPEPIVELEKLSLDLTIRKIERRWQQQAAEAAVEEIPAKPREKAVTAAEALAAAAAACGALATALAALMGALGMRRGIAALATAVSLGMGHRLADDREGVLPDHVVGGDVIGRVGGSAGRSRSGAPPARTPSRPWR